MIHPPDSLKKSCQVQKQTTKPADNHVTTFTTPLPRFWTYSTQNDRASRATDRAIKTGDNHLVATATAAPPRERPVGMIHHHGNVAPTDASTATRSRIRSRILFIGLSLQ
jgi:hypothetical protein